MNSCQQAEKIVDYLLQQLTAEEKEEFEAHLQSCVRCRQELRIEQAIENELSTELNPGFIESRVKARLQLHHAKDMRFFWLYVFRMFVYGVTAAIVSMIVIPFLLKLSLVSSTDLSKHINEAARLLGQIAPVNAFIIMFVICYLVVLVASMYSLTQIRR